MPCDRWWEKAKIIGTVKTKPITFTNSSGEKGSMSSETHPIVKVVRDRGTIFYVTNKSYEPQRKCEPLVIVNELVKSYKPKR